jgi:formamidopyrimidine-DNA glycosylase
MPEGPEVRRSADLIAPVLVGQPIADVQARTKAAKAWLAERPGRFEGRLVERVWTHGKHLVVQIEGDAFVHVHLMMWGRWFVVEGAPGERERKERLRIVTPDGAAILNSAPVVEIGEGDPYEQVELLASLGPETLPYPDEPPFDAAEARRRLLLRPNRSVGAALLDQQALAGLGNYLRADVLFACGIHPWKPVGLLGEDEWEALLATIPEMTLRAYQTGGRTLAPDDFERVSADPALSYPSAKPWQQRHYVFRRTNLPCLACGTPVRQNRQVTRKGEETRDGDDKTRIIYFCPACQGVDEPAWPGAETDEHVQELS